MKNIIFLFLVIILLSCSCSTNQQVGRTAHADITEITYWQYWTGFEGKAIEQLVNKFNETHSNIKVKMLTISEPRKKTLLSIIGGTPPDVISTITAWLPELSTKGALIPLDNYCQKNKIAGNLFIPAYWKMVTSKGHIWALPTTPTSNALYWNKNLFIKAGLDPEKPPKTLKELEEYSKKLTVKDENGKIKKIGFLPSWPSWVFGFYGVLFNGAWANEDASIITANNKNNIEGWKWAQGFVKSLGTKNIQTFQEEFGNYQGPNNPFYTEKIAFEINGVWEGNFIPKFAPNLKWGATSIPSIDGKLTTIVDSDCIIIPKGSKHPDEAFEFISWLMQPENIEELCLLQGKFSPLKISDREDFIKKHPHPYIKVFIDAAKSDKAISFPQGTYYELYKRELKRGFESVMRLEKSPEDALNKVQKNMEREISRQAKYETLRL